MSKTKKTVIIVAVIAVLGAIYWYMFMRNPGKKGVTDKTTGANKKFDNPVFDRDGQSSQRGGNVRDWRGESVAL